MSSPTERYVEHIEAVCGGEGEFFRISDENEEPAITVISYRGVPEEGSTTAFSFGLSSLARSEWINSRPELVISVNSLDASWPLAMGELIRNGRDKCTFSYGQVLDFGQQIADESEMTCFLVFACSVLEEADLVVQLPDRKVHLSQIYPIYASELPLIQEVGAERFLFGSKLDPFDVKRARRA